MSSKYKIAIQFFGHLRTFEKCATSIKKHLLDKYDCDVFMHTWSETEHSTQTWHNNKAKITSVNEDMIKKIEAVYQTKMTLVEKQILSQNDTLISPLYTSGGKTISAAGMNFMLQSQIKSNELRKQYAKKNNITYDLVVMIRPDIFLYSDLELESIIKQSQTTIDYPARFCVSNALKKNANFAAVTDLMSDILFVATPSDMDLIVQTFKQIRFEKYKSKMWTPESLTANILFNKGIASLAMFFFFNRDFEILRGSYYGKEKRRRVISFKISGRILKLNLFSFMKKNIISLNFSIFNLFNIDFSIGKPYAKC